MCLGAKLPSSVVGGGAWGQPVLPALAGNLEKCIAALGDGTQADSGQRTFLVFQCSYVYQTTHLALCGILLAPPECVQFNRQ